MSNTAHNWLYALECVLVPVLWGLLMVQATALVERFFSKNTRKSGKSGEPAPKREASSLSPEYYI